VVAKIGLPQPISEEEIALNVFDVLANLIQPYRLTEINLREVDGFILAQTDVHVDRGF
jgi:hypothetical protein